MICWTYRLLRIGGICFGPSRRGGLRHSGRRRKRPEAARLGSQAPRARPLRSGPDPCRPYAHAGRMQVCLLQRFQRLPEPGAVPVHGAIIPQHADAGLRRRQELDIVGLNPVVDAVPTPPVAARGDGGFEVQELRIGGCPPQFGEGLTLDISVPGLTGDRPMRPPRPATFQGQTEDPRL